jgi:membrane protease YdiL (CAAX protease family)
MIRALVLSAALIGWSRLVAPRLTARRRVPAQAALAVLLVASAEAPLGLRPPALCRGARAGLAVAAAVSAVVGSATVVAPVRRAMSNRVLPEPVAPWLLVHIPIGTVWSEEAAFRGALGTVAAQAFGPRWGRVVQAGAFGLSHVADARGAGESVAGTVLVTGLAGWAFGWLNERAGSLIAPMLAHLAVNEAAAVAALVVRGQTARLSISSR